MIQHYFCCCLLCVFQKAFEAFNILSRFFFLNVTTFLSAFEYNNQAFEGDWFVSFYLKFTYMRLFSGEF